MATDRRLNSSTVSMHRASEPIASISLSLKRIRKTWCKRHLPSFGRKEILSIRAWRLSCSLHSKTNSSRSFAVACTTQYEDYVEYVNDIRLSTFREPMLYDEYRQAISQIINGLSEQQRTVFVLHRLQGLSHKQIAAQLQLSEQTTRNLLSLALKEIRQQLQNRVPK